MTRLLAFVIAVSAYAGSTYTAESCSRDHVNAAIATAVDGDTVKIPAGTCTWSSAITISQGISIIGAGEGSTVIQDALNGTLFTVNIPSATSSTFRLSGMTITPTSGAGGLPALMNISGTCNATTCSHIRIDHITTTGWILATNFGASLIWVNNVFGVVDHLTVGNTGGGVFMDVSHGSYGGRGLNGDNSWAQPDSFGTDNAIYIEDSSFASDVGLAITDTDHSGGGRFVGRFLTMTNANFQTHGTESPGRTRGGRHYEIYGNHLTVTTGEQTLFGMRSGTGLFFNNTKDGAGAYNSEVGLEEYRSGRGFPFFGNCNGTGPYDQNDGIVYASGTVESSSLDGSNLSVTDTTKSWTGSQWVANPPYSVVNMSKIDYAGFRAGGDIATTTTHTVTSDNYNHWKPLDNPVSFDVGNTYQILRATRCIDQPGNGPGDYIEDVDGTPSPVGWVHQSIDPVYEWGSTIDGGGAPYKGWVREGWAHRFAANRDYYQQVSPFTGASGTGTGLKANMPATCTAGVAYWATDEGAWNRSGSGGQGRLYKCTATDTWTLAYTPYTYPHPLVMPMTSVSVQGGTHSGGRIQ